MRALVIAAYAAFLVASAALIVSHAVDAAADADLVTVSF